MRTLFTFLFAFFSFSSSLISFAKKDLVSIANGIEREGKMLYRLEKASWHGTDLFMEKYQFADNIGGYFSYLDKDTAKCIFVSKTQIPQVIGTIIFDHDFSLKTAKVILNGRSLTEQELEIFNLRKAGLEAIASKAFPMKFYENTRPNIIPVIQGNSRRIYILTGPEKEGVLILGNDYLLEFNAKNVLKSAKSLHKNIIPIEVEPDADVEYSMHNHQKETGDFITATDICTLMLYGNLVNNKQHHVISKNYWSIWNFQSQRLVILPKKAMETMMKINKEAKSGIQ